MTVVSVSDQTIARLNHFPPLVWKIIAPDSPDIYESARRQESGWGLLGPLGLFSRLRGASIPELPDEKRDSVDLGKAWGGIHDLLTSSELQGDAPLNFLVRGGEEIGNQGIGVVRVVLPAYVAAIDAALDPIDEEWLRRRFDQILVTQEYPQHWRGPPDPEDLQYWLENFGPLKSLVNAAANRRWGLLISAA